MNGKLPETFTSGRNFNGPESSEPVGEESLGSTIEMHSSAQPKYYDTTPRTHVSTRPKHVEIDSLPTDVDQLRFEVLRLRDELIGCIVREGELRARLHLLQSEDARRLEFSGIKNHHHVITRNEQLEEQIDSILRSRTWRLGALLLWPSKPIRAIIRKRN